MRHIRYATVMLALALAAFAWGGAFAQAPAGQTGSRLKLGQVDIDFQYARLTPLLWHLTGRVKMTSEDYDLAGADIKVYFSAKKAGGSGVSSLLKATADGSAGTQVTAHVRQPLQSQAYDVLADHAVYLPDAARPGYAEMVFTGHVKIVTHSGFLAEPSLSQLDHATVLLGPGEDYPQLETGPAHLTLTPAQ